MPFAGGGGAVRAASHLLRGSHVIGSTPDAGAGAPDFPVLQRLSVRSDCGGAGGTVKMSNSGCTSCSRQFLPDNSDLPMAVAPTFAPSICA